MKRSVWLLLLLCCACTHKKVASYVNISLINNNKSLKIKGLDYSIISEINRDSVPGIWESLLPVSRMPSDTDLKNYQPVQHGTYILKDSAVMFTPDTAFVKGQAYFMRYYQFKGDDIWDYVKGKKRLGAAQYIDLVIKP